MTPATSAGVKPAAPLTAGVKPAALPTADVKSTALPFSFELPTELEAREPPEARGLARDMVRLLVSQRASNRIYHARFADLPDYLRAGDLLVVNASATLPSALDARLENGDAIRLHVSTRLPGDLWIVEPRAADGAVDFMSTAQERPLQVNLPAGARASLLVPYRNSKRLWIAAISAAEPFEKYLYAYGRPIGYGYLRTSWPLETFQTVYARVPGSAEMPSAGRPFTLDLIEKLHARGTTMAEVVLHAGVASPERDEPPYEEWYSVCADTAAKVNAAKRFGHRVIAVGTTTVRALESSVDGHGQVVASNGWTDLIVSPQSGLRVVDTLITGFHEPRSTHLALLEAIAGKPHVGLAYRAALDHGYLWHEFGDSHMIL